MKLKDEIVRVIIKGFKERELSGTRNRSYVNAFKHPFSRFDSKDLLSAVKLYNAYTGLTISTYSYARIWGNTIENCVTCMRIYTDYNMVDPLNEFYNYTTILSFLSSADNNEAKLSILTNNTTDYLDEGTWQRHKQQH